MSASRVRARELGIEIGSGLTGRFNAITDVAGVEVGHCTVRYGTSSDAPGDGPARTGVTVIWPHRDGITSHPVSAGFFALSGTGEMTGRSEIQELGRIFSPIVLTNTFGIGVGLDGVCRYLIQHDPDVGDSGGVLIPVVAECDDSFLHDARGHHLTAAHVAEALDAATSGPVAEGSVGSGTGMHLFRFKGGIGTSSRVLPEDQGGWTIGVLTMTNFGSRHRLTVDGVPIGKYLPLPDSGNEDRDEGSGIVVLATDAPLDPRQLERVAKRASLGLGRTGSIGADGSGELIVAFSTTYRPRIDQPISEQRLIESHWIDPIFEAAIDATEESVLNALCMATTVDGRHGRSLEAISLEKLSALLRQYGRGLAR